MKFDDVLSALCTTWETKSQSDFQTVYSIADAKQAKLVFDVLRSYGFEVKVYAEEKESKLYTTKSDLPDAEFDSRISQAIAYAGALAPIKSTMDDFCAQNAELLKAPDYTVAFSNTSTGSKQIVISMTGASQPVQVAASPAQPTAPASSQPQRPQQAATQNASTGSSRYARKPVEDNMFSGPQLLRDNNKIISKKDLAAHEADSSWHQFKLYVKGNSAVAGGIIAVVIIVLFSIFSMFIVSKGFLCPDLAHKQKKVPWYCESPKDDDKQKDPNALPDFTKQ